MNGLFVVLLLSAALVQPPATLAARLFADLGARVVPCPVYTLEGENQPYCARTDLSAEAFRWAFVRARNGRLEPTGSWREDHGVWLRLYRGGGHRYAVVYTTIARTFNVQVVCLGCR